MRRLFFFTFLLFIVMAVETSAQNVLAVKTRRTDAVTRASAPGGWQETWGTSAADLMNVTTPAYQGSDLLICMMARQGSAGLKARAFGVEISNSAGDLLTLTHVTGHIYTLTPDLIGSGCFHWSPPADDDYTFKLMTFQSADAFDLTWTAERQILVLELIPSPQKLSSLSTNQVKTEAAELLEAVKELKAENKTLKRRIETLESK